LEVVIEAREENAKRGMKDDEYVIVDSQLGQRRSWLLAKAISWPLTVRS